MSSFLLQHRHEPRECGAAFASWRGFSSELRHRLTASTCPLGGHAIWWRVEAADAVTALALLPQYVAHRTTVTEIREVRIP